VKHLLFVTIALLVLVSGSAMAQCGGSAAPAQSSCGMAAAPVAGGCGSAAAAISAQATQNGYTYTYALNDGSLEKRKSCGMVVTAVKVDCPMLGGQAGAEGCGGCAEMAPTATAGCGAGMASDSGCGGGGGCGMHGDGPGKGPKLTADADGVYLKCQGKMFAWDLDLNATDAPASGCSMGSEAGGCGGGSCSMAGWEKGPSENRGLQGGIASLKIRPMRLAAGVARLQLTVFDTQLRPDGDAIVSAFVYPTGQPEAGSVVEMTGIDAGEFRAAPELAEAGVWELAVRVVRPDSADEVVYYMLDVN